MYSKLQRLSAEGEVKKDGVLRKAQEEVMVEIGKCHLTIKSLMKVIAPG